jgi:hypothetical protein
LGLRLHADLEFKILLLKYKKCCFADQPAQLMFCFGCPKPLARASVNVGQITDGGANEGDQVYDSTGKRITGDAPRLYFGAVDVAGGSTPDHPQFTVTLECVNTVVGTSPNLACPSSGQNQVMRTMGYRWIRTGSAALTHATHASIQSLMRNGGGNVLGSVGGHQFGEHFASIHGFQRRAAVYAAGGQVNNLSFCHFADLEPCAQHDGLWTLRIGFHALGSLNL